MEGLGPWTFGKTLSAIREKRGQSLSDVYIVVSI